MPQFGLGNLSKFRFGQQDDPMKDYIAQGSPIDPTTFSTNQLPQTPKTSVPTLSDKIREAMANRPQRTELESLIKNEPKREDYQPNKMTRLGAILGGISAGFKDPTKGVELAQSMRDRPYSEAMDAYERRMKNVSALAGLEGQDLNNTILGITSDEDARRSDRTFDRGAFESDRSYNRGVTTSDREFGLDQQKFNLSGFRDVKNNITGRSSAKNLINGQEIDFGQTDLTPEADMKMKKDFFRDTQGSEGDKDRANRLAISQETTKRNTDVANIRANNARIIAEQSIGADEGVKRQNTELGNQLTNPNSPLFDLDLDKYTEIGPTGTRKFKKGVAEDKNNAAIVGALSPYLQVDAGKSRSAEPNSTAKEILDAYEKEHQKPTVTPPPAGRGRGAGR